MATRRYYLLVRALQRHTREGGQFGIPMLRVPRWIWKRVRPVNRAPAEERCDAAARVVPLCVCDGKGYVSTESGPRPVRCPAHPPM